MIFSAYLAFMYPNETNGDPVCLSEKPSIPTGLEEACKTAVNGAKRCITFKWISDNNMPIGVLKMNSCMCLERQHAAEKQGENRQILQPFLLIARRTLH